MSNYTTIYEEDFSKKEWVMILNDLELPDDTDEIQVKHTYHLTRLIKARDIIFEVEQEFRDEKKSYAADTLFKVRIEINNAMSRYL